MSEYHRRNRRWLQLMCYALARVQSKYFGGSKGQSNDRRITPKVEERGGDLGGEEET